MLTKAGRQAGDRVLAEPASDQGSPLRLGSLTVALHTCHPCIRPENNLQSSPRNVCLGAMRTPHLWLAVGIGLLHGLEVGFWECNVAVQPCLIAPQSSRGNLGVRYFKQIYHYRPSPVAIN